MIIDFHTHIFPSFIRDDRKPFFFKEPSFKTLYNNSGAVLAGRSELVRDMDAEGIDKSIVFGFPWKKNVLFKRHNDYILESILKYPSRLIGFCCFDFLARGAAEEAERCLKAGMAGIGELAVYESDFSPDIIDRLGDIMALCSEYDAPILLHTNEPVGHYYPGKQLMSLSQLYSLLKRYPSNRIILAHWGGGLFFYGLMKRELRDVLKNVWFDTAASPYLYTPEIYRIAVDIVGADKILFGSDYPLIKQGRYFKEMEQSGISQDSIRHITGHNVRQLLSIQSSEDS